MTAANEPRPHNSTSLVDPRWSGAAMAAVAIVALFAIHWNGIVAMVEAWARPEYSFGPLVPLVSAYMLLHEMRERQLLADGGSRMPGLLVLTFGVLTGLLGNLSHIPYLIAYGFIISIGGLALVLAGFKQGLRYWPGWIHLLFMLPLPNFLYWHLSGYLQLVSSKIGVEVIHMMGIPVFLDGNIIDLGVYQLQVAEACNGLRYLFPLMSFGYLFAVLYRGPIWQKLLLFFLTIPITVLMNSLRIGVIGVLVNSFGIDQAEGFLHLFEGWIIFVSCVVILYIFGIALQWLQRKHKRSANILDLDFEGLLKPLSFVPGLPATRSLFACLVIILAGGGLWIFTSTKTPPILARQPLSEFPLKLGEWTGERRELEEWTVKVLAADEYLLADYKFHDDGKVVNLFISYYNSTIDGTGIHSPQICIPGSGWEVFRWQEVDISPSGGIAPFAVNRAIIQKGNARQLVYYWFEQRGKRLAGEVITKLYTVYDSAVSGRADGALVRIITPLDTDEPEANGDRRLQDFMKSTLGTFPDFISS